MKKIKLTQGRYALVDDADYERLNRYKWYTNKQGRLYHAARNIQVSNSKQRRTYMHQLILSAPTGMEVDHINGNGLDNRKSNLRLCSHRENGRNRQLNCNNTTGFKGVTAIKDTRRKPYISCIGINGKKFYLGCYETAEKAARIYDLAALKYHGEFALTNKMMGLYRASNR